MIKTILKLYSKLCCLRYHYFHAIVDVMMHVSMSFLPLTLSFMLAIPTVNFWKCYKSNSILQRNVEMENCRCSLLLYFQTRNVKFSHTIDIKTMTKSWNCMYFKYQINHRKKHYSNSFRCKVFGILILEPIGRSKRI